MSTTSDTKAMNMIAQWMEDFDPVLDASVPEWVWSLVSLLDDLIDDTGRDGGL